MPNIIDHNSDGVYFKGSNLDFTQAPQYDYKYPKDIDLDPRSDTHRRLKALIRRRAQDSWNVIQRRHSEWEEIDRVLKAYAYQPLKTGRNKGTEGENDTYKIVMPVSYAALETILTYMVTAFLQNPIFRYQGTGPEDVVGALLMQEVINLHCHRSAVGLSLHTMFRDSFAYGIGVTSPRWYRRMGYRQEVSRTGFISDALAVITGKRKQRVWKTIFEGNRLDNIDPYRFLPDPNVSAHRVQDGEFVGWMDRTNAMALIEEERDMGDGIELFNCQYLKHFDATSAMLTEPKYRKGPSHAENRVSSNNPVDVIWMYVNLIPKDWEIGDSEYPEKWLFGLAGDEVLIAAQPLDLDHDQFPVAVAAPDYDGYSVSPASRLGIIHDMQTLIDFLYSSHIMNVRKAINDMIVVDPSLVNILDLQDPQPGKLIRLRRKAWGGGGIDSAIKQLSITDVTANHVNDTTHLTNMLQNVTGAPDILQGIISRRGPRVSASEAQGARSSSLSRLEKAARIIGMQAMQPIAYQFASNTQQFMDEELFVKSTGELEMKLRGDLNRPIHDQRLRVKPMDLVVEYDLLEYDGSIPGGEDLQTWVELFQTMSQNPHIGEQFDMVRVFKHIARQAGAKNVDDFEVHGAPQVMDDEEVLREIERGNLQPVGGDGTA